MPVNDKTPPSPPAPPIVGHIPQWQKNPLKLMTDAARYGDVVQLSLRGKAYLLTHPRDVKHVLQDNHQNYCKGWVFERIKPYWGESLLTADGEQWRQQRRRIQPSFKREHTTEFAPGITRRTGEMIDRWETASATGQEIALYPEMTQLALVIIADVLFGVELWGSASEMVDAVQCAVRILKTRVAALAPVPLWVPTTANRRFNKAMRRVNCSVSEIIDHNGRRENRGNFVATLMAARDGETGATMSERQLRDEIIGMLQQGHDTIGEALAWTWYLLAQNPEIQRKLASEVDVVLGGRTPVVADLERLTYAAMVIQESLRLFPPVWIIPRDAIREDRVGGYRIPAGATVLLSPYLTHRHTEFWPDRETFDPERFRPEQVKDRPRHAYFPFGGGPRLCMGADMAMMETVLILAMVAQRFTVQLAPGHREEPECLIDMVPRYGVRLTLHRREPLSYKAGRIASRDRRSPPPHPAVAGACPWHTANS